MIEKFTFNIEFPKKTKKIILIKTDNEARQHIVLKLLAFLIYYADNLKIEAEVGWHYKPDLVRLGEDRKSVV